MDFKGFIGGSYHGRSKNLDSQRTINLFVNVDIGPRGSKSYRSLEATPGSVEFSDPSYAHPVRAKILHQKTGVLYKVVGDKFFTVAEDGTETANATLLDTTTSQVWMADNDTQVMVTDGTSGYIYDTGASTFTKIVDADFPTPSSLTYQDGYFIVTKDGTAEFYISDLDDGTNWSALDFTTAEGKSDNLVACIADHRDLIMFGQTTTEYYRNTGASFPFEIVDGATQEVGLGAAKSITILDNAVFSLDNFGRVVKTTEYVPMVISTRQLEHQIEQYVVKSDAFGYGMIFEGRPFYVLTFPTDGATWMYNVATDEWNEWSSFPDYDRHRSNCYVKAYGKHMFGDYRNGKTYYLDSETFTDDDEYIPRSRISQHINNEEKNVIYDFFQLDGESGRGLATGQGVLNQIMLRFSDDGGYTWSNEFLLSEGKLGKYGFRSRRNRLGMGRDRVFWVRKTDPTETIWVAAYLGVRPCRS